MTLLATRYGQQKVDTSVSYTTKRAGEWDIRDFGGVGDSSGASGNGTNNDLAFENALLTLANIGYGKIVVPGGKYRTTVPINIDWALGRQEIGLEGRGINTTNIFSDQTTRECIFWGNSEAAPTGNTGKAMQGRVGNFSIQGRGPNNVGTVAVLARMSSYTRLERILVTAMETGLVMDAGLKFTTGMVCDQFRANNVHFGMRNISDDGTHDITDCLFIKFYTNGSQAGAGSVGFAIGATGANGGSFNTCTWLQCSAESFEYNWLVKNSAKNLFLFARAEGAFPTDDSAHQFVIQGDVGQPNVVVGPMTVTDTTGAAGNTTGGVFNWPGGGAAGPHTFKQFVARPSILANHNGHVGVEVGTAGTVPDALWFQHMMEDGSFSWQALNHPIITGHAPSDADFPSLPGPGSLIFRTDGGSTGNGTLFVRAAASNTYVALN